MHKTIAFILPKAFEDHFIIRVLIPGIDQGGAVYLEHHMEPESTREQTREMLGKIVEGLR